MGSSAIYWALGLKDSNRKSIKPTRQAWKTQIKTSIGSTVSGLIFWRDSLVPMQFISQGQNEGLQLEGRAQMHNAKVFYESLDYSIKESTD